MLAGTTQRRGPSSSVLKHSTAGDHISNIFSLIVSYFVAFPPFQPPLCGSAQLSHCWNLPKAWVPAAQQLSLAVPALPMSSHSPALPQPHGPAGHPDGDPSPTGWASCSLPGLSSTQTATSSPYPPSFHHSVDRTPGSSSICQLLRPTQLSDTGHFSATQSVPQPLRKHSWTTSSLLPRSSTPTPPGC